jgi:hypothetical protein
MTDTRKTLTIYLALWCLSLLLAFGSTLWLGLDARIPVDIGADGAVIKSRSIAVLWLMPGMATVLFGSMGLGVWFEARRARRRSPVELGEDALRSLALYGRTIRNGMIGFGVLILVLQVFSLLRASGIPAPLGLDREGVVRFFNVVAGALFAYIGNVTPKLPWPRRADLDTSAFYDTSRRVGWVFTLGGIGYILSALIAPFDRMIEANGWLIAGMLGLPVLIYLHALALCVRRTARAARDSAR